MSGRYDDLLYLPHPEPTTHPRMSIQDRAAQFSPFAALTGYGAVIQETARQTEPKRILGEDQQAELDSKLRFLLAHLEEQPEVTVCHFQADAKKNGGTYRTSTGVVKKLDPYQQALLFTDGTEIALEDLWSLEGDVFSLFL